MLKHQPLCAMTAAALAIATLFAAGPAAAAARYAGPAHTYAVAAHPSSCWRYSDRVGHWVNFCRTYSYRHDHPQYQLVYPGYGRMPYPYRFEPPIGSNGPYIGAEPYNGYESALGFWF
jgi:hypothetical protein